MTRLDVCQAREKLPELVNRAARASERTILSHRSKDLAAIVPMRDLRLIERLTRQELDRIDIADAKAALREAERKGTVSLEQAKKRLNI